MSCYDGQIVASLNTSSLFVALRTATFFCLTWLTQQCHYVGRRKQVSFKKPAVAVTNELLLASATANSTVSEEQRDTSSFLHQLHGLCKPEAQGYMDHWYFGPLRLKPDKTRTIWHFLRMTHLKLTCKFFGETPLTPNTNQWTPCQAANSWCWWCHCHAGGQMPYPSKWVCMESKRSSTAQVSEHVKERIRSFELDE